MPTAPTTSSTLPLPRGANHSWALNMPRPENENDPGNQPSWFGREAWRIEESLVGLPEIADLSSATCRENDVLRKASTSETAPNVLPRAGRTTLCEREGSGATGEMLKWLYFQTTQMRGCIVDWRIADIMKLCWIGRFTHARVDCLARLQIVGSGFWKKSFPKVLLAVDTRRERR